MKRTTLFFIAFALVILVSNAQVACKYGRVNCDSLLKTMPEYTEAQAQLQELRRQYDEEAAYNDGHFKQMFADFLQGQKDFPQNIMLKRQRELQEAMEKSIAFRRSCDSLLVEAERDLLKPVRQLLDAALYAVGCERGYECIVNTAANSHPFLHPELTEDVTPFVLQKLHDVRE